MKFLILLALATVTTSQVWADDASSKSIPKASCSVDALGHVSKDALIFKENIEPVAGDYARNDILEARDGQNLIRVTLSSVDAVPASKGFSAANFRVELWNIIPPKQVPDTDTPGAYTEVGGKATRLYFSDLMTSRASIGSSHFNAAIPIRSDDDNHFQYNIHCDY